MKSLVVYSSQTGNTQKLAEAVYETLPGEKEIHSMAEAPDPAGYDLVAVGFWLKAGKPDPATLDYLPKVGPQSLFLFATHGAAAGSAHAQGAMNHAKELAPKATVVGTYSCPGEVDPQILEKAAAKTPPPEWLADAPAAAGHPNEADLEELKAQVAKLT